MNTKLSLLTLGLTAAMASGAFAGDIKPLHAITGSLTSPANVYDVYKMQCGAAVTGSPTGGVSARVADTSPVMQPKLGVQVRLFNGTVCDAATQTTVQYDEHKTGITAPDNDSNYSSYSTRAIAANGLYCVKVFKAASNQNTNNTATTAVGAENFSLDQHCHPAGAPTGPHNSSINQPSGGTTPICNNVTSCSIW